MSINIGNAGIKNLYLGGTPIKSVYLGDEKIYPMEIIYQESGNGDFDRTFDIPEGYKTLSYCVEIITGDNVNVMLYNNDDCFEDRTLMSGVLKSTISVSSGTLRLQINPNSVDTSWTYKFILT